MKDIGHAQELGSLLKVVGESFHVKTDVVHSSMNQPLGRYAGVWCEVEEALSCLKWKWPQRYHGCDPGIGGPYAGSIWLG